MNILLLIHPLNISTSLNFIETAPKVENRNSFIIQRVIIFNPCNIICNQNYRLLLTIK